MAYRGGSAGFFARHMVNSGGSCGGTLLAFIITFIVTLIFSQNIFIAGFLAFIIAGIFAIFGG